jgi:hypothetical protein
MVGRFEQPKPTPPKSEPQGSAYAHEGSRRKQGAPPQIPPKKACKPRANLFEP